MKTKAILIWILQIAYFSIDYTTAEFYRISRTRPQGENGWTNGVDHFTVPSSQCSDDSCGLYNGIDLGSPNCNCVCLPTKTTFAFTDGQLHCVDLENSELRTKLQSVQYSQPGEKGNWI